MTSDISQVNIIKYNRERKKEKKVLENSYKKKAFYFEPHTHTPVGNNFLTIFGAPARWRSFFRLFMAVFDHFHSFALLPFGSWFSFFSTKHMTKASSCIFPTHTQKILFSNQKMCYHMAAGSEKKKSARVSRADIVTKFEKCLSRNCFVGGAAIFLCVIEKQLTLDQNTIDPQHGVSPPSECVYVHTLE